MAFRSLVFACQYWPGTRSSPAVAVITIALGVGTHGDLQCDEWRSCNPLPYRDPGKLVIAGMFHGREMCTICRSPTRTSSIFVRGTKQVFSDMAGSVHGTPDCAASRWLGEGRFAGGECDDELLQCRRRKDSAISMPMTASRSLRRRQIRLRARVAQLPQVAILSYEYFQRRFGGDPAVMRSHHAIHRNPGTGHCGCSGPRTPPFSTPESNEETSPDLWLANRLAYDAADRNGFSIRPVARLRDGMTLKRAQEAADIVAADGRKGYIDQTAGYYIDLGDATASRSRGAAGDPGADGFGDFSAFDCVRQRGQSSIGSRLITGARICRKSIDGYQPLG